MSRKGSRAVASPRRIRLPGFIVEGEIGLGTLVSRLTSSAGIRPCGGCARRAAALDRRIVLVGRRGKP